MKSALSSLYLTKSWVFRVIVLAAVLFSCRALRGQLTDSSEAQHIAFPDARLQVIGLAWFDEDKPELRRLPARLKDAFRPPVWSLAQQPSGGRIRFKTDSTKIAILAQNPDTSTMHHMTTVGQSGFDIYVNGEYLNSAWPDNSGKIVKEWSVGARPQLRDVTIYLPLYKAVTVKEIVLEKDAKIEPPTPFALPEPVVYYAFASTCGRSWTACTRTHRFLFLREEKVGTAFAKSVGLSAEAAKVTEQL
jgi:hypothetical protein